MIGFINGEDSLTTDDKGVVWGWPFKNCPRCRGSAIPEVKGIEWIECPLCGTKWIRSLGVPSELLGLG